MTKKKIVIATGGTGGHVFPAYGLANYLIKNHYEVNLISDERGLKYLKEYKNLKLKKIPASPLLKKNLFKFSYSVVIIFFSVFKSFLYLLFNRPLLIFGMGGYSSFPVCIAAKILRIKFVIYENNLIIGKANKFLLPFTKKIFVSYKEVEGISEKYKYKILEIGNILREQIINSNISEKKEINLNTIKVLVLGGSQAAKAFADLLPPIFKKIKNSGKYLKVYQQCLKNQNNQLIDYYGENNIDHEIFNFTNQINDYYSKVNLVITRAGASVLGELINVKIPFISIPLPSSADNHQQKNAEFYKKKGYGFLLEEEKIKDNLYNLITIIFKDKSSIENILLNQSQYSDKKIYKNLIIKLEKIINEKN